MEREHPAFSEGKNRSEQYTQDKPPIVKRKKQTKEKNNKISKSSIKIETS